MPEVPVNLLEFVLTNFASLLLGVVFGMGWTMRKVRRGRE